MLPAANGPEALEILGHRHGPVDLLLTDVVMPQMQGRLLADKIQARWPGIRVLFMSAHTQSLLGAQGVLARDVHVIEKPFDQTALLTKLNEVLGASYRGTPPGRPRRRAAGGGPRGPGPALESVVTYSSLIIAIRYNRGGSRSCAAASPHPGGGGRQMNEPVSKQAGADPARIRVFLLDDHEVVRRGLKGLLEAEADIDVVGEAGTSESALGRIKALQPDVALLDIRLPDGDGVSLCREIRSALPGTACLMLTAYSDDQALMGAIVAGAAGYVMKQTSGPELVGAVRTVAAGQSTLDAHTAQRVMARLRERTSGVDPVAALSGQEKRVLDLISEGMTNREIAEHMFLSEKTAKNYVSSLLSKLGMQRRSQAAAFAARLASAAGK